MQLPRRFNRFIYASNDLTNAQLFPGIKERKVDEEIPCLRQLLHWNSSPAEGRGKTHAAIIHRLRQLNRNDLADWLGETTFKQLGKDLENAITLSFDELAKEEMETSTSAFRVANYTQSRAKHDQNILYIQIAW